MILSVVVPTVSMDRYEDIIDLVNSLKLQSQDDVEILIVVGRIKAIYEKLKLDPRASSSRVLYNPGDWSLSAQRNYAIGFAKGDLIGFLDDDVVTSNSWVQSVKLAFSRPLVIGLTGPVEPLWLDGKQRVPNYLNWVISCTSWIRLADGQEVPYTYGGNMVFRREIFDSYNLKFSTQIGLGGTNPYAINEDSEFSIRAREACGGKIIWCVGATVFHKIKPRRTSYRNLIRRSFSVGYTQYVGRRIQSPAYSEMSALALKSLLRGLRDFASSDSVSRTLLPRYGLQSLIILLSFALGFLYGTRGH